MKRVHINVSVENLERAIDFYGALFGARPDVVKEDYARFRLDEPSINFSISARGHRVGVDHLGIDVDSCDELEEVAARLKAAGHAASETREGACCYATSAKSWTVDPAGVPWETFHTFGTSVTYGTDALDEAAIAGAARREGVAARTTSAPGCC